MNMHSTLCVCFIHRALNEYFWQAYKLPKKIDKFEKFLHFHKHIVYIFRYNKKMQEIFKTIHKNRQIVANRPDIEIICRVSYKNKAKKYFYASSVNNN